MKRRGFFGLMAGAAAAGPSMAKQAVTVAGNAMSLDSIKLGGVGIQAAGDYYDGGPVATQSDYDHAQYLKGELSKLLDPFSEESRRMVENVEVYQLDPDIASLRSLSLQTKVRMQRDVNIVRNRENRIRSLKRNIADYVKQRALGH